MLLTQYELEQIQKRKQKSTANLCIFVTNAASCGAKTKSLCKREGFPLTISYLIPNKKIPLAWKMDGLWLI